MTCVTGSVCGWRINASVRRLAQIQWPAGGRMLFVLYVYHFVY